MIIIIMGVSGSGKTTIGRLLASSLVWPYFDGDDFHNRGNIAKMNSGTPLTDNDRLPWLEKISRHIENHIKTGQDAIISCSALKQQYRRQLQVDPELIKFVYLKGSKELIKKRLESRTGHFMNKELLSSQFDALEIPEQAMIADIHHPPEHISKTIQAYFGLSAKNN